MEEEYRSIYQQIQQIQQKTFKVILMKIHEVFPNYDKPGKRDLEPARTVQRYAPQAAYRKICLLAPGA